MEEFKDNVITSDLKNDANQEKNGMSIASLIFGILGIIVPNVITQILAIILGVIGKKKGGKGLGITGIVLGIVGLLLDVILVCIAVVVFNGLQTPDSANFSAFCNDCDTVYIAVMNRYGDLRREYAINGDIRTSEQTYIEVATGSDPGEYAVMGTNTVIQPADGKTQMAEDSTNCQKIEREGAAKMNIVLPKVRQDSSAWYVMSDGRVFNATGYVYNDRTYWQSSFYTTGEQTTIATSARAEGIASSILNSSNVSEIPEANLIGF